MHNRKWTIDPDLLAHTQNYRRIFLINSTVQWNPNWFAHTQPVAVGGKYVLGIGALEQPCLENWAGQLYFVVNHIFKKKKRKLNLVNEENDIWSPTCIQSIKKYESQDATTNFTVGRWSFLCWIAVIWCLRPVASFRFSQIDICWKVLFVDMIKSVVDIRPWVTWVTIM